MALMDTSFQIENGVLIKYTGSEQNAVIPEGVASIGKKAFRHCNGLVSVTIPDGVKTIEYGAFSYCKDLKSVTIPDSVTSIGDSAFLFCVELDNVTIPEGVTYIGESAFSYCKDLKSVTIPDSVTYIGEEAFYCDGNLQFTEYGGCKYLGNANNPYLVLVNAKKWFGPADTIHEQTKIIYGEAFKFCRNLISLTIPESVACIGKEAFANCKDLKSVTIGKGVTNIGEKAFEGCYDLASVTIPNGVKTIENGAFFWCSGLESVAIPDSVKDIGEVAFLGCSRLMSITIGCGVTSIGKEAFSECWKLATVYYTGDLAGWISISFDIESNPLRPGAVLCLKNADGEYEPLPCDPVIPEGVTRIGNYAFQNWSHLKSITIPDSVTSIGTGAFLGCNNLQLNHYGNANYLGNENHPYLVLVSAENTSITSCKIPEQTRNINDSAFAGCGELTRITIPDGVTGIGDRAFADCRSLTDLTIGNSVAHIGEEAFKACSRLASVTIGNSVASIGNHAFDGCLALKEAYYEGDLAGWCKISFSIDPDHNREIGCKSASEYNHSNPLFRTKNLHIKNANGEYELMPPDLVIPEGVTSILDGAFIGCDMKSVTIPDSVKSIGRCSFSQCARLTSVTIPESVITIGGEAFSLCNSLQKLELPKSLKSIGKRVCIGCYSLLRVFYRGTQEEWKELEKQFRYGAYAVMENFHRPGQAPYTVPWTDEAGRFSVICME